MGRRIDAALDAAGNGILPQLIALTGDAARVLTFVDLAARELGVRLSGPDPNDRFPEGVPQLARLVADGKLRAHGPDLRARPRRPSANRGDLDRPT
jgi:hypothetical protein